MISYPGQNPRSLPDSRDELSALATDLHAEDELEGVVHAHDDLADDEPADEEPASEEPADEEPFKSDNRYRYLYSIIHGKNYRFIEMKPDFIEIKVGKIFGYSLLENCLLLIAW
jgi:hypothetical protein